MAILQALHLLVLASAALAAPSDVADRHLVSAPALCDGTVSAFLVSDNTDVEPVEKSREYQNVTEDSCRSICSNNKDTNGRSTLCASFTYDHENLTCTVFRERSYPDGKQKRVTAQAKRHFEKICLGEDLPVECAESEFLRADGFIVDGFATNVTIVKSVEACVSQCLREQFVCKSAMYFPEEGECITNTESATTKPDHFNREENDEVIYIQNGCAYSIAVQERLAKAAESAEEHGKAKAKKPAHKKVRAKHPVVTTTSTSAPAEETTEHQEATTVATKSSGEIDADTVTTPASGMKDNRSDDSSEEENSSEESETEAATESTTESTTTTTTTTEAPKTTKKARKHKKRPSKKTTTTEAPTTEAPSTEAPSTEAPSTEAPSTEIPSSTVLTEDSQNDGDEEATVTTPEPTESSTSTDEPLKPDEETSTKAAEAVKDEKDDSEKKEKPQKEEPVYFSEWSEWTACTIPGERKIRRRMCLNMKKCVGSLMEISWCPEDLPVQVEASENSLEKQNIASGPVGPVRAPLPVADAKGTSESGSPPSILPPQMPKRELKPLPSGAPGTANDIWSPWLGVCQHFASGQPCKNHEVIGFESRECIAKDPSLCKGPFFRYCTLKC